MISSCYWIPNWAQNNNVKSYGEENPRCLVGGLHYMELLDCEFSDEFGGILAHFLINGNIGLLGQQLDATDEKNIFKIGPDCWELFDGKTDHTVEKPISQELFDKAIRLAADELNISIL